MLSSQIFYVELNNDRSRWRNQKNGLPQGSVLSPILFNMYTNDQPLHDATRNLVYADDLRVTAQYPSFTEVEHTIEEALDELTTYYRSNSLRANPDKTQGTSFHLKNKEAKRMLEVKWNNTDLENTPHPMTRKKKRKTAWHKRTEKCKEHELTQYHQESLQQSEIFTQAIQYPTSTVSTLLDTKKAENVERNRTILKCVLEAVIYCGRQCISLRGDNEKLNESGNPWNVLSLLKLMANHNEICRIHLEAPQI